MEEEDIEEDDPEEDDRLTEAERLALTRDLDNQYRAIELYSRAKEGDEDAFRQLASLVNQGDRSAHHYLWELVTDDNEEARRCYLKIAAEGFALAQYNVAHDLYRWGERPGHSPDMKRVVWWAELSAAQGFSSAQDLLGRLYYSSESDYNDDLYRVRADYKETGKAYYLDEEKRIIEGGDIKQDFEAAFKWFTLAATAKESNAHSQYMLGEMHERGRGCVKDMEKAIYWYKQVFVASHYEPRNYQRDDWATGDDLLGAEVRLGDIYYYGEGGVRQNFKSAFTYYRRATVGWTSSIRAKHMVAKMYERGDGIKQNPGKALKLYKQVARWTGKDGYKDAQEKAEDLTEWQAAVTGPVLKWTCLITLFSP